MKTYIYTPTFLSGVWRRLKKVEDVPKNVFCIRKALLLAFEYCS